MYDVPIFTKQVIVKCKDSVDIGFERMVKGEDGNYKFLGDVTHWMPIPKLND